MSSDLRVFISYARVDSDRVSQLAADIGRVVDDVWLDARVAGGQQWWARILDEIKTCSLFVLVLSANSVRSDWCRIEADWARSNARPILPVLIDDIDVASLPRWWRGHQVVDCTERTVEAMLDVFEAVQQLTRAESPRPVHPPDPPAMPTGPFDHERERLGQEELSSADQLRVLAVLRDGLDYEGQRQEAAELLERLADRNDVTKAVHEAVGAALGRTFGREVAAPPAPGPVSQRGSGTPKQPSGLMRYLSNRYGGGL